MVLLEQCPECHRGQVAVSLDGKKVFQCNNCGAQFRAKIDIKVDLERVKEILTEEEHRGD